MKKGQTKEFTLRDSRRMRRPCFWAGQAGKPVTFEGHLQRGEEEGHARRSPTSGPRRRWASSPSRTCTSASREAAECAEGAR